MTIKGMIFDLDGTLVDTLADLTDAMNAALTQCGCPERSLDECRQMIGSGQRKFAERALPGDQQHLIDQLLNRMVAHYRDHCCCKTVVYAGLGEVIEQLKQKNIRLAVLTNKNQSPTDRIVGHYFDAGTFDPVLGVSEGVKVKPDPTSVRRIISDWGFSAGEVLYVGDSDVDVETARNAGIGCLACLWGFRSKSQLLDAGAEILVEHPAQILDHLG